MRYRLGSALRRGRRPVRTALALESQEMSQVCGALSPVLEAFAAPWNDSPFLTREFVGDWRRCRGPRSTFGGRTDASEAPRPPSKVKTFLPESPPGHFLGAGR